MIPCTIEMTSIGIWLTNCIRVAPARNAPNSSAAGITPSGWLFPSSATAMLSKP